jgi:hypothetical protein
LGREQLNLTLRPQFLDEIMDPKRLRFVGALLGGIATIQLLTRGVSNPYAAGLLYGTLALGVILCVISELLTFRDWRANRENDAASTNQQNTLEAPPRPQWMGDPAENRRRLMIVVGVFAALGCVFAGIFLLLQ